MTGQKTCSSLPADRIGQKAVEVAFKLLKVGLFDLSHKDSDVFFAKIELEVDGAHAFTDEVDPDIEDVVSEPYSTGSIRNIIDWE